MKICTMAKKNIIFLISFIYFIYILDIFELLKKLLETSVFFFLKFHEPKNETSQ